MATNPSGGNTSGRGTTVTKIARPFRPVLIFLLIAMPVLCWDLHRRFAPRTKLTIDSNIEGAALEGALDLQIGGKFVPPGNPVPIGFQKISLSTPNAEPFEIRKFIWYGQNRLGPIQMKRSRGALQVSVNPPPTQITVSGAHTNLATTSAVSSFQGLPAGDYRIEFRFRNFTREARTTVGRNSTNRVERSFPVGSLKIQSTPPEADVALQDKQIGKTPLELIEFPAGRYQIQIGRPGFNPAVSAVEVLANETNIFSADLISLRYTRAMERAQDHMSGFGRDYAAALKDLSEALEERPGDPKATTQKKEVEYLWRHQEARDAFSAGKFKNALASADAALVIKPDSKQTLDLKVEIQNSIREADERLASEKRREEERAADARRREEEAKAAEAKRIAAQEKADAQRLKAEDSAKKFAFLTQQLPKDRYEQRWKSEASLKEVEDGIQKTIIQSPDPWALKKAGKLDDLIQFHLSGVGLGIEVTRKAIVQFVQFDGYTEVRAVFWRQDVKLLPGVVLTTKGDVDFGTISQSFRTKLEKAMGKTLQ